MNHLKDRLAHSIYWIVWSRGAVQVVSFLSTLLIARLLTPADYGLMALTGIWISTTALLAELGLGAAIVQFQDLEERELNACFWLTMSTMGVGYLTLYICAPTIAAWFSSPMLSSVLRVVGLSLPMAGIRMVPDSLLRKQLRFEKISQAEIASVAVYTPLVLGMAWAGAGVWALVAGALVIPLVQSVASFWFVRWWPGFRVGGQRLKEILSYSIATLGARICWVLYQEADTFVLGKISGNVVLGFYSLAKQVATLPVEKVSVVVNQLASPVMAELQADREAMRIAVLSGIRLVAWATFPLCIGLMLVAEDFVRVTLTEKWISIVPMLRVLCIYAAVRSVAVMLPPVLMALYRAKFLFFYNLTFLVVMPLAFWAGATWGEGMGLAIAWVSVYPVVMIWMMQEALSELNVSWKTFVAQLWRAAAATLAMVFAMLMVRWGTSSSEGELAVGRLVAMSLAGAAVYSISLLGIGGPVRREIQEIARWVFRSSSRLSTAKIISG